MSKPETGGGASFRQILTGESDRTLSEHRLCIRCGYDLFRLGLDAACPECGGPVADSIRSRLLRGRPIGLIRSLVWGGNLLVIALFVPFLAGLLTPPLTAVSGALPTLARDVILGADKAVLLSCSAAWSVAWLMLSRDDPGEPERLLSSAALAWLRVSACVSGALCGVWVMMLDLGPRLGQIGPLGLWQVGVCAAMACACTLVVGLVLVHRLLDIVAQPTLRRSTRFVLVLTLAACGLLLAASVVGRSIHFVGLVAALVGLWWYIAMLALAIDLRNSLKFELRMAQAMAGSPGERPGMREGNGPRH